MRNGWPPCLWALWFKITQSSRKRMPSVPVSNYATANCLLLVKSISKTSGVLRTPCVELMALNYCCHHYSPLSGLHNVPGQKTGKRYLSQKPPHHSCFSLPREQHHSSLQKVQLFVKSKHTNQPTLMFWWRKGSALGWAQMKDTKRESEDLL